MNPDTIALGVRTTVVGLGIVFMVLVILMFLTGWLDKIIESMTGGGKTPPPAGGRPAAPPPPRPAATSSSTGVSAMTVAAIMGAVSAFSGKPLSELVFTSISREGVARPVWNQTGVVEQISTRQHYL
ncbi:MAG: OadG family protein [Candidatus Accumulibacter sp.]|jgi:sodium pump decarboxylase gamma subunit|nr:OadG family protein [Accumulibacter sp.]